MLNLMNSIDVNEVNFHIKFHNFLDQNNNSVCPTLPYFQQFHSLL